MPRSIAYIDSAGNKVDKRVFLEPLRTEIEDISHIERLVNAYDYTGTISLPIANYETLINHFPNCIKSFIADSTNLNGGRAYLRGRNYYLHIVENNDKERVFERLLKGLCLLQEQLENMPDSNSLTDEELFVASSVLDHRKHYSMAVLNLFFENAIKHPENQYLNRDNYKNFKDITISSIEDYYSFMLRSENHKSKKQTFKECDMELVKRMELPKDSVKEETEEAISGASKIIVREMDHPAQIILYAGNMLKHDGKCPIDITVNPLKGATEIGYGLKSVFDNLNIYKIQNIILLKYSHYDNNEPDTKDIANYMPQFLLPDLQQLRNKRVFIIDDNGWSGLSLRRIREMLSQYSDDINLAVIERAVDSIQKLREAGKPYLRPEELAIPAIAKLRHVDAINRELIANNFGGKHD